MGRLLRLLMLAWDQLTRRELISVEEDESVLDGSRRESLGWFNPPGPPPVRLVNHNVNAILRTHRGNQKCKASSLIRLS